MATSNGDAGVASVDGGNKQILELLHSIQAEQKTLATRLEEIERSTAAASGAKGQQEETFVGSIDQGTTSTRFLIFNKLGEPVASKQIEFKQIYPHPG